MALTFREMVVDHFGEELGGLLVQVYEKYDAPAEEGGGISGAIIDTALILSDPEFRAAWLAG